jgi:ferrochelatase
MTTGIVLLNFGEPSEPDRDVVVDYLERIFFANMDIEGKETTEKEARARASKLAQRRAPGLMEEYEEIGGSPLYDHATTQASMLADELDRRGYDVNTYYGMQYTEPFITDAVERARADGVDHLVGLPIYPLCGPSTNVQSLDELDAALDEVGWDVPVDGLTGWHKHPGYTRCRIDNIRAFLDENDLSLGDGTQLVFSAHGTPQYYLDEGSRYEEYVEEFCGVVATALDAPDYALGYQNHENRDVEWTEPDVEAVIENVEADRVVVEPVSFMHEQSETLSELDVELREEAEAEGLDFYRVPIPYDDERFVGALADLVEPFVAGYDPSYAGLQQCKCRDVPGTMCLNAAHHDE